MPRTPTSASLRLRIATDDGPNPDAAAILRVPAPTTGAVAPRARDPAPWPWLPLGAAPPCSDRERERSRRARYAARAWQLADAIDAAALRLADAMRYRLDVARSPWRPGQSKPVKATGIDTFRINTLRPEPLLASPSLRVSIGARLAARKAP